MKPGVAWQRTTLLPKVTSQKRVIASTTALSVWGPATSSSSRMVRGGLKKWVMRKFSAKPSGMPVMRSRSGMVEVLDDTGVPGRRTASMRA